MIKLEMPKPDGLLENIEAFFTAVDVHEGFVRSLIGFHVLVFILIIFTRHRYNVHLGIFAFLLVICYYLEKFNLYLAENWKSYTNQNYFDKSGLFLCVMVGFPALCNCLLIMFYSMCGTFQNVKQLAQLKMTDKTKMKKNE
jgi:hypothetical protein